MQENPELFLPRQSFSDRHPEVAQLDGNFPRRLGIALGTTQITDYPAVLQSALSVAHEYSDSSLEELILFADPLIDPDSNDAVRGYLPNFLEGLVTHRLEVFERDKVKVTWVGGESLFSASGGRAIKGVTDATNDNPGLSLVIVLDPSRLQIKPDILLTSEQTSEQTREALIGPTTKLVSVGESITEINGRIIDQAIVNQALTNSQT